ncbi:MAG: extracellular solute-binding protein [Chloroflexi bacterium]|nr:extracellular solute-binding protein [Chloroflexota bacterium]
MFRTRYVHLLVIVMVLGLLVQACAPPAPAPAEQPSEAAPAEQPAEEEVVTIEYWQYFFEPRVDAMSELIRQFEEQNPGIKVVQNADIPYAEFRDKIAASVPAGVGPDVVTLFYGWLPAWVDAGYLVPLPEDEFSPDWIESSFTPLVKAAKFQGKYWAIPTAVRTLALFWNKDLFAEAGLDPEKPPQTLDEFVDYARKLTQYDDSGNIIIEGYAPEMPGQAHHWFREVLVRQFGGQPFDETNRKVMWNSPEGCQAFKWLLAFETEYKTGSNDLYDGATQAFLQGKEALHIDGSFRLGTIAKNAPDLNFGVAPLPVGPDGTRATFGSYWTHGITKKAAADPKRMEAAIKFLKFITSPEAGRLWVKTVGELPAQLEAAQDEDLLSDPKLGAFAQQLPYAHATFFVDESKQRQALIDAFDAVRLTGQDPCEALNEAAAIVQELYDEFWATH